MNLSHSDIAHATFDDILKRFPGLTVVDDTHDQVDVSIILPVQEKLSYEVCLNLQNEDELHFSIGHFWLEWFPCTDPAVVKKFISAVTGFISGEYRILEHYRGTRCVKAELQKPHGMGWKTVGTSSKICLPVPWRKTYATIRNNRHF